MHTHKGYRFEIGTKYAPSVADIAIGLARIPRWAGATIRPWSVLQHSLAAGALVESENKPILHLAALFHDAEEMATSDIPKPFKTAQQSELGSRLWAWLYDETLNMNLPPEGVTVAVKVVDERLKFAELITLCHPRAWWDPYFRDQVALFNSSEGQEMEAIDAVWELVDMPEREQIWKYTKTIEALLATKQLQSMRSR